ncbi:MAG: hypothetical protein R3E48_00115 [Burkholderiaceae bacterium]
MDASFRDLVDGRTGLIDRRIFADPLVYERELAQIFGRCWLLLGHECQIRTRTTT